MQKTHQPDISSADWQVLSNYKKYVDQVHPGVGEGCSGDGTGTWHNDRRKAHPNPTRGEISSDFPLLQECENGRMAVPY